MFELNQITQIINPTEVDLDTLIDVSFPAMNNGTYIWPENLTTDDEKKSYYKELISKYLNANPSFFAFKRNINGVDVSLNIGLIQNEYWCYAHALVGNLNGSRSWIFDENITPQQTQFLSDNGFKGVIMNSYGNSAVVQHQIKKYQLLGDQVKITENWQFDESTGILKTKVDFISSSFHNVPKQSDTRLS